MSKKKVLIIGSHINVGGAARIARNIHFGLKENGYDVKSLFGRGDGENGEDIIKIDSGAEVYYSALMTRLSGKVGMYNQNATKRAIKIIDEWKPDIIHLQNIHGYYINIEMLFEALAERNIPVVWTLHDCFSFTGKCGYHFECERWREGCGECPMLKNYPKVMKDKTGILFEKKKELFTSISKMIVVTPSDWLTSEAKESYLGKYECVTIRNGIDTGVFYPRETGECRAKYGFKNEDRIILGMAIGFSDPRKGADYLIGLAKAFENKAKVVLVGWEKENDKVVEGISNIVTVPAIKDSNTLAEYYSLSDVFVIPSLAENYATTVIEAEACGTHVVGFDTGGIPEQITEGRGLVVEARNQEALNKAVQRILDKEIELTSPETLSKIIQKENSIEAMVDGYCELYDRVL